MLGSDDKIRVVTVQKPDRSKIKIAICNIYPLELDCSFDEGNSLVDATQESGCAPSQTEDPQESDPVSQSEVSEGRDEVASQVPSTGAKAVVCDRFLADAAGTRRPARTAALKFKEDLQKWISQNEI